MWAALSPPTSSFGPKINPGSSWTMTKAVVPATTRNVMIFAARSGHEGGGVL